MEARSEGGYGSGKGVEVMTAPFDTTELRRLLEESLTEPVVPEGGCNTMAYRKDWYQWQRSKRTLRRAAVNALYGFASPAPTSDDTRAERKAAYEDAGSGAESGLEITR